MTSPTAPISSLWPLVSLAAVTLLAALGVSLPTVALPQLATDFSASIPAVQGVILAYLLGLTATIVSAGRLGDLQGHRRMLLVGLSLYTLAAMACALAPTLWGVILARLIQGAGAALLMALGVALVRDAVPTPRIGRAMGLLGTMSALGTALGPVMGGLLLAGPGWRGVFLLLALAAGATLILAARHLPHPSQPPTRGAFPDALGAFLLAISLSAYALAMSRWQQGVNLGTVGLLVLGLIAVGLFGRRQRRAAQPLIDPAALQMPGLAACLFPNALVATVMMATLVVGPFYLAAGLGLSPEQIGCTVAVGPITSALSGIPAGRLVDRIGARRATRLGLIGMAVGATTLALLPNHWGLTGYIAALILLTPGYQLFHAANNSLALTAAPSAHRGTVSGLLSLSRNLGLMTGASAMGAVFVTAVGTPDLALATPQAIAAGLQATFLTGTAAALLALLIAIGRTNPAERP